MQRAPRRSRTGEGRHPSSFSLRHTDHLGSTGYTTGASGNLLQHDEYFPGGEVWFEEVANGNTAQNRMAYLFNAKELDETGLYYYGARYYNPRSGVWVSPDPILSNYLKGGPNAGVFDPIHLGLYTYTRNNPVRLLDPSGLAEEAIDGVGRSFVAAQDVSSTMAPEASETSSLSAAGEVKDRQNLRMSMARWSDATTHPEMSPLDVVGPGLVGGVARVGAGLGARAVGTLAARIAAGAERELAETAVRGGAEAVTNAIPETLARVIGGDVSVPTLGRPGAVDVFVTAAEDVAGMTPAQIAERLTIPQSSTFTVYTFETPAEGLASPILRSDPGFTGGGLTAGGAREFVLPNGPMPAGAIRAVVRP